MNKIKEKYNMNLKFLLSFIINWFFIFFIIFSFYTFFIWNKTNKIENIIEKEKIKIIKINKTDILFKEIEDKIWKKIKNNFILEKIEIWKYDNIKKCQNFKIYYYPDDIKIFTTYFIQKWYSKENIAKKIQSWVYRFFVLKIKHNKKYIIKENIFNICL